MAQSFLLDCEIWKETKWMKLSDNNKMNKCLICGRD